MKFVPIRVADDRMIHINLGQVTHVVAHTTKKILNVHIAGQQSPINIEEPDATNFLRVLKEWAEQ